MSGRRNILLLFLIIAAVAVTVAGLSNWVLYEATITEQRERLVSRGQQQARLIVSEIRFELARSGSGRLGESGTPTLEQILLSQETHAGFGKTGEFLVGRRAGDMIEFILPPRFAGRGQSRPLPFDSGLAEPMRQALEGRAGTMVGKDYGGVEVLADYRPLEVLDLGFVTKIDSHELRQPFVEAAAIGGAGGLVILLIGAALFRRTGMPLVRRL